MIGNEVFQPQPNKIIEYLNKGATLIANEVDTLDFNVGSIANILEQKFSDRNISMPKINENQALILDNTHVLENIIGTARGIYYSYLKSKFFIMPGVPNEMKHMQKQSPNMGAPCEKQMEYFYNIFAIWEPAAPRDTNNSKNLQNLENLGKFQKF